MNSFAVTLQHTSSLTCRRADKVTASLGAKRDDEQRWRIMPNVVQIPRGSVNEVCLGQGKGAETKGAHDNLGLR